VDYILSVALLEPEKGQPGFRCHGGSDCLKIAGVPFWQVFHKAGSRRTYSVLDLNGFAGSLSTRCHFTYRPSKTYIESGVVPATRAIVEALAQRTPASRRHFKNNSAFIFTKLCRFIFSKLDLKLAIFLSLFRSSNRAKAVDIN
jgi:hypothetical protein